MIKLPAAFCELHAKFKALIKELARLQGAGYINDILFSVNWGPISLSG